MARFRPSIMWATPTFRMCLVGTLSGPVAQPLQRVPWRLASVLGDDGKPRPVPGVIDPGPPLVPSHPIYLPPLIWGPTDPRPTNPIAGIPGLPGYEPPNKPTDPPPAEGVREPLTRVLTAPFEFVVLRNCGHTPWLERAARAELYEILGAELA